MAKEHNQLSRIKWWHPPVALVIIVLIHTGMAIPLILASTPPTVLLSPAAARAFFLVYSVGEELVVLGALVLCCRWSRVGFRRALWLRGARVEQFMLVTALALATKSWGIVIRGPELAGPGWPPPVMYWIIVVLLTPLAEELFFRGYVFSAFNRSPLLAAVASTILFTLYHYRGSAQAMVSVIPISIVVAYGFYTTGSVWTAVVAHASFNLVAPLAAPVIRETLPEVWLLSSVPIIVLCGLRLYALRRRGAMSQEPPDMVLLQKGPEEAG